MFFAVDYRQSHQNVRRLMMPHGACRKHVLALSRLLKHPLAFDNFECGGRDRKQRTIIILPKTAFWKTEVERCVRKEGRARRTKDLIPHTPQTFLKIYGTSHRLQGHIHDPIDFSELSQILRHTDILLLFDAESHELLMLTFVVFRKMNLRATRCEAGVQDIRGQLGCFW
jgi:hypothetical protein